MVPRKAEMVLYDCIISIAALWAMMKAAVGTRLQEIQWASTLFPNGLWRVQAPIPLGEVIGMAARMIRNEEG